MKPPPMDHGVSFTIGLHKAKDGEPVLSIGKPGSNVTRVVRRKKNAKTTPDPPKPEK